MFGWGRPASLGSALQLSSLKRQFIQLQFVDPYFLDTKLTFAADAFRTHASTRTVNFIQGNSIGDPTLTFGYPLSEATRNTSLPKSLTTWLEDARLFLTYTAEDIGVSPVFQGTQQQELANQFGTYILSSARLTLTIDKRNDRLYPSNGYMLSQSFELVCPSFLGSASSSCPLHRLLPLLPPVVLGLGLQDPVDLRHHRRAGREPDPHLRALLRRRDQLGARLLPALGLAIDPDGSRRSARPRPDTAV